MHAGQDLRHRDNALGRRRLQKSERGWGPRWRFAKDARARRGGDCRLRNARGELQWRVRRAALHPGQYLLLAAHGLAVDLQNAATDGQAGSGSHAAHAGDHGLGGHLDAVAAAVLPQQKSLGASG